MIRSILIQAIQSGAFEGTASGKSLESKIVAGIPVVPGSLTKIDNALFMLFESDDEFSLAVLSPGEKILSGFTGESLTEHDAGRTYYALVCPLDHNNAVQLRKTVPHTGPSVLSCRQSFGTGDRIGGSGAATPWHIEAFGGYDITPVLAQQSVRENHKTGRTFEQIIDDVTWSALRCGCKSPWGADADHLKDIDKIAEAVRAGFTMFTLDPSDFIDNDANSYSDETLNHKFQELFPDHGEAVAFISRYEGRDSADSGMVVRSGVKYLPAVRHAIKAYHCLVDLRGESNFNFEMSIDETSTTTTALDHRIIATELAGEEVRLFSLAPRFEGEFEKAIDYRGTLDGFRRSLETHVKIAGELGGYRMSLHSGSDKFSIYPIFGEVTDGFFHVKTAGTSFLEAVKVIARADIDLYKKIHSLSVETFDENAASYHISADVSRVPDSSSLDSSGTVEQIENNPDLRQVLHIAFGVVLKSMGEELRTALRENKELYRHFLVTHMKKHLSLLTGR